MWKKTSHDEKYAIGMLCEQEINSVILAPLYMLWTSHRNRMDLHPKVGLDVETDDATHIPLESEKIIHIMRLSGKRRAGPQGGPKMASESREGQLAWSLMVVRGPGWGEGSYT